MSRKNKRLQNKHKMKLASTSTIPTVHIIEDSDDDVLHRDYGNGANTNAAPLTGISNYNRGEAAVGGSSKPKLNDVNSVDGMNNIDVSLSGSGSVTPNNYDDDDDDHGGNDGDDIVYYDEEDEKAEHVVTGGINYNIGSEEAGNKRKGKGNNMVGVLYDDDIDDSNGNNEQVSDDDNNDDVDVKSESVSENENIVDRKEWVSWMKKIKYDIRFPLMSAAYIESNVIDLEILTQQESMLLMLYLSDNCPENAQKTIESKWKMLDDRMMQTIIKSNIRMTFDEYSALVSFVPSRYEQHKWVLLYRASEHEFDSKQFHFLCDNVNTPTIVIAESSQHNNIFGGYTEAQWDGNSQGCRPDENAFLFLLRQGASKVKGKATVNITKGGPDDDDDDADDSDDDGDNSDNSDSENSNVSKSKSSKNSKNSLTSAESKEEQEIEVPYVFPIKNHTSDEAIYNDYDKLGPTFGEKRDLQLKNKYGQSALGHSYSAPRNNDGLLAGGYFFVVKEYEVWQLVDPNVVKAMNN